MHVLMLGWEFPPFITGGLGTACFGLTKAMDRRGMRVTFVVPKSVRGECAEHVTLLSPDSYVPPVSNGDSGLASGTDVNPAVGAVRWITIPKGKSEPVRGQTPALTPGEQKFSQVQFVQVPAGFSNPYTQAGEQVGQWSVTEGKHGTSAAHHGSEAVASSQALQTGRSGGQPAAAHTGGSAPQGDHGGIVGVDYSGDIVSQAERYAHFCLAATRHIKFDIIHAHDWMTYPAGLLIARASGKPLVAHIHSTEFDRSGEHVNQRIYDIERRGMHGAMRVIAVSQLTKNLVVRRYGVPEQRVEVVYNGVDLEPGQVGIAGIESRDKIVLYFGRITYQKGPEYFIQAAKRVLEVMPDVKFVVAGSGDQAKNMIEMAANLGIGHKVLFTGFLRGNDIKKVFSLADLYVMPSVSEPFGIAPLEAMSHNVPALISRSSGVSEVLSHVLKVDFWDIDDMANKIIAVLKYPPLSQTLKEHGAFEVRRLTWDGAAERCEQVYYAVMHEMTAHALVPA